MLGKCQLRLGVKEDPQNCTFCGSMTKNGMDLTKTSSGDLTQTVYQSMKHIVHICAQKQFKHMYMNKCTQCADGTGKLCMSQHLGSLLWDPFHFWSLAPKKYHFCAHFASNLVLRGCTSDQLFSL